MWLHIDAKFELTVGCTSIQYPIRNTLYFIDIEKMLKRLIEIYLLSNSSNYQKIFRRWIENKSTESHILTDKNKKKTDWSDVERTTKKLYSYSRNWRIIKIFLPNRTKDSNNVELWAIWLETYLPQGHRLCQTWVHHQSRCSIHWPAFQ